MDPAFPRSPTTPPPSPLSAPPLPGRRPAGVPADAAARVARWCRRAHEPAGWLLPAPLRKQMAEDTGLMLEAVLCAPREVVAARAGWGGRLAFRSLPSAPGHPESLARFLDGALDKRYTDSDCPAAVLEAFHGFLLGPPDAAWHAGAARLAAKKVLRLLADGAGAYRPMEPWEAKASREEAERARGELERLAGEVAEERTARAGAEDRLAASQAELLAIREQLSSALAAASRLESRGAGLRARETELHSALARMRESLEACEGLLARERHRAELAHAGWAAARVAAAHAEEAKGVAEAGWAEATREAGALRKRLEDRAREAEMLEGEMRRREAALAEERRARGAVPWIAWDDLRKTLKAADPFEISRMVCAWTWLEI